MKIRCTDCIGIDIDDGTVTVTIGLVRTASSELSPILSKKPRRSKSMKEGFDAMKEGLDVEQEDSSSDDEIDMGGRVE